MRSRNCLRPARGWIARLLRVIALLAGTVALSACGEEAPQPSALELLQAGERPYTTWDLAPASTSDLVNALEKCIDVASANSDLVTSSENLADAGWQRRDYPADMVTFVEKAGAELREGWDGDEEYLMHNPLLNSESWPRVFDRDDTRTLLALREVRSGVECSVLADIPDDDYEAISRAVSELGRNLGPREETPHGFSWRNNEVVIFKDYGNGFGGPWEFMPPVFGPIQNLEAPERTPTANLSVYNCKGTC